MDKPSKDGNSADYWSRNVGRLDMHYSSGPANHFFYLLSEGSGAKTIHYFTSSTAYAGARSGTLQAAADLYGSGGAEYNAVAAAWKAVNVN